MVHSCPASRRFKGSTQTQQVRCGYTRQWALPVIPMKPYDNPEPSRVEARVPYLKPAESSR